MWWVTAALAGTPLLDAGTYAVVVDAEGLPPQLGEADLLDAVDATLAAWSVDSCVGLVQFERTDAVDPWLTVRFDTAGFLSPGALMAVQEGVLWLSTTDPLVTLGDSCADAWYVEQLLGLYIGRELGLDLPWADHSVPCGTSTTAATDPFAAEPPVTALTCEPLTATEARCTLVGPPGVALWSLPSDGAYSAVVPWDTAVEVCLTPDDPCLQTDCLTTTPTRDGDGCGCDHGPSAPVAAILPLVAVLGRRRRR